MKSSNYFSSEEIESARKYWLQKLSGEPNEMVFVKDYKINQKNTRNKIPILFQNNLAEKLILLSKH